MVGIVGQGERYERAKFQSGSLLLRQKKSTEPHHVARDPPNYCTTPNWIVLWLILVLLATRRHHTLRALSHSVVYSLCGNLSRKCGSHVGPLRVQDRIWWMVTCWPRNRVAPVTRFDPSRHQKRINLPSRRLLLPFLSFLLLPDQPVSRRPFRRGTTLQLPPPSPI